MDAERPLVSFCVTCYNRYQYIEDALRTAFVQTYSPLEIVISDDASTDGSQKVIEALVEEYRKNHGRHNVVFLKNEKNLGCLGNTQRVYQAAHGELLIQADGDDVFCPSRTSEVVDAWLKSGKKAVAVVNHAVAFTDDGSIVGFVRRTGGGTITAYSKRILDLFKSIDLDLAKGAGDDAIFLRRVEMFGTSVCIPKILTCYRWGSGATTKHAKNVLGQYRKVMIKGGFTSEMAAIRQLRNDVEDVRHLIGDEKAEDLLSEYRDKYRYYEDCMVLWDSGSIMQRWKMFAKLYFLKERLMLQIIGVFLCLPRFIGDRFLDAMYDISLLLKNLKYRSLPKLCFDDLNALESRCETF